MHCFGHCGHAFSRNSAIINRSLMQSPCGTRLFGVYCVRFCGRARAARRRAVSGCLRRRLFTRRGVILCGERARGLCCFTRRAVIVRKEQVGEGVAEKRGCGLREAYRYSPSSAGGGAEKPHTPSPNRRAKFYNTGFPDEEGLRLQLFFCAFFGWGVFLP